MADTSIGTQGDENWVLSADGAYIYVAGNDGYLRVFDAHTGESLYSVDLGADLGAISLSPDGTRLAIVEEVPENVQQFQSWTENSADVSLYIVDLSTFGAQKLTFHVTAESYTFADVTWSDNDTLQLSQNILPGWSGWAPIATIELATGALTEHSSYYSGLGTSASLLTIPGSTTVLLGQLGLSSAEYFLIAPDGTALTSNGVYDNDVYGYAGGIEAASGATASDRIIIVTGGGAHLYDGTMAYIGNLASLYPNLGNAAGVTFSADGQRLFFLDSANQAVVVVDAYNYSLVATVSLAGVNFETLKWGEEIVVAPDGNGVYYNTSSGIAYVSVDLPDLGTDGADQLSGTAGDDIIDGRSGADLIYGLDGDDWLIGGAGNDHLDGGDGFDIASYETATSGVSVDLGIAAAQATGGADSDTLVSIEGLSGSIFNDSLTGNSSANLLLGYDGNDTLQGLAGDDDLYGENGNDQLFGGSGVDWLFGGSGDDSLDGGTGADRLEGGDGNDTYIVDDAGDVVLETATGGYDTMQVSNFSATIASSVEALVIVSGAVNAAGDFAANSLTGSDQANVLSGLGGNDNLAGGAGNDTLIGGSGADTLTGGAGADIFKDTAAGLNGDTITDFGAGDVIVLTDATLAGFTFNLSGSTLTYSGGSLTLNAPVSGTIVASAAAGGGVQLSVQANATDDVLYLTSGPDFLDGSGGSDLYIVQAAGDHPAAEISDTGVSGTDEVRFSATGTPQTLRLFAGDTGIERVVIGTGTGASAVLTGLTANNVDARAVLNALEIIGNSGANTLYATAFADSLSGGNGIDRLYGYGSSDLLDGGREADVMYGGTGDDTYVVDHASDAPIELAGEGTDLVLASVAHTLKADVENLTLTGLYSINGRGNALDNLITGNSGSNRLWGEGGNDTLIGNGGGDQLDGGSGDDTLIGGTGNDLYFIDSAGDTVTELGGEGIDRVETMISYTLGADVENLTLAGAGAIDGSGNALANTLKGNGGANLLSGLGGNDKVYAAGGSDVIDGGTGNDWLEGGSGLDQFTGGSGSDRFVFRSGDFGGNTTATADIIHDFSHAEADKIRLDLVDADTTLAGTQDFAFIGSGAFTGIAGQLRYEQISGNTYVSADTNGDGIADFMIRLDGLHTLVSGDFIL